MDNIDRCLELWDTDGPTKALKYYMQFYRFISPNQWNGFRNIDEPIDIDKIRADQNYDDDEDEPADKEEEVKDEKTDGKKSKSGKDKSKKEGKGDGSGETPSKEKKKKEK